MNSPKNKCNWIELAAMLSKGHMIRHHYVDLGDRGAIAEWKQRYIDKDVFRSIACYLDRSCKSSSITPLYFDIDCFGDLSKARESTIQLCHFLIEELGITEQCLHIAFSGSKGFHVLVPTKVFNHVPTSRVLEINKQLAQKSLKHGVKFLDLTVYSQGRLWRLENTLNTKSGLNKIPLVLEELCALHIKFILRLAQKPRPQDSYATPIYTQTANSWFKSQVENHLPDVRPQSEPQLVPKPTGFRNGWRMTPCVRQIEKSILPDGLRHKLYLCLARYYSYLNMHPDEIRHRIEEINERNPVHDPDCINRIVDFGNRHPGFPGCDSEFVTYCDKQNCFFNRLKVEREGRSS